MYTDLFRTEIVHTDSRILINQHNKIISSKEELLDGPEALRRPGADFSCAQALGYPGAASIRVWTRRSWEQGRLRCLIIF